MKKVWVGEKGSLPVRWSEDLLGDIFVGEGKGFHVGSSGQLGPIALSQDCSRLLYRFSF